MSKNSFTEQYQIEAQQRFSQFILAENRRLDRLIHNLYLKFQLDYYSERDLYDHICQELAQYFRADCALLYLIRYEEAYQLDEHGNKGVELIKWLDLVGAFGPWKRALRPQYRRERSRARYEIPFEPEKIPETGMGLTRKGFFENESLRFSSGYDFRSWREGEIKLRKEDSRNVVWYQDGLYNSSRCILMSPIVREGSSLLFSVESKEYQRDLDDGKILDDLRKAFENHYGILLSQDAISSTVEQSVKWLIKVDDKPKYSVEREKLFSLDSRFQSDLKCKLSQSLRREFEKNKILLSQKTIVTMREPDTEWLITDKDRQYIVRKQEDKLNVIDAKKLNIYTRGIPFHSRIGLIKIENRSPRNLLGFWETAGEDFNHSSLLFKEEWSIAALRPYLEDLPKLPKEQKESSSEAEQPDPFLPIHNNVGWRQYFEDHSLGSEHFRKFLNALDKKRKDDQQEIGTRVMDWYKQFGRWLEQLVECLIRVEAWLQHLRYALQVMCGIGEKPSLNRPIPSLFNVYNLRAAYIADPPDTESSEGNSKGHSKSKLYAYEALQSALFGIFTRDETEGASAEMGETKPPSTDSPDKLEKLKDLIQKLCETKMQKIGDAFAPPKEQPFDIGQYLAKYGIPDWNFQTALEIVKGDLEYLCEQLKSDNLRPREEKYYYLFTEEVEVRQIQKTVDCILKGQPDEEKCRSQKLHINQDRDHVGCLVARALAAATGYADTFSQADELRLSFIAGHVTQVLDNYLLHQARQRGLSLDFEDFDALGLERFGLGLLDELGSLCQRIERTLWYLLRREAYRRGLDISLPKEHESTFKLSDFVKEVQNRLKPQEQEFDEFCLLSIRPTGIEKDEDKKKLECDESNLASRSRANCQFQYGNG